MRFTVNAGVEIETVTPAELQEALTGWRAEVRRGVKTRHFSATTTATAGETFVIDGTNGDDELGPRKDFVWKLLSVAIGGNGFTQGTDAVSIFIGDATASRLVASGITRQHSFAPNYLMGGEVLGFTGAATADALGFVTVSGYAIEAPAELLSELL
jgi:hypothetical protein